MTTKWRRDTDYDGKIDNARSLEILNKRTGSGRSTGRGFPYVVATPIRIATTNINMPVSALTPEYWLHVDANLWQPIRLAAFPEML
jgi:hypothetical protein